MERQEHLREIRFQGSEEQAQMNKRNANEDLGKKKDE